MKLYTLPDAQQDFFAEVHSWAISNHNATGCSYSGYPYSLHLDAVVNVGKQYLHLIAENNRIDVMCALSCHDLIEDARVSYRDIKDMCGDLCANIVYNVTNELGRNRKERAEKTYPKIASCHFSTFVKLCDRIANMKFSYFMNDEKGMFLKYKEEHSAFFKALHNPEHPFEDMWKELQSLGLH